MKPDLIKCPEMNPADTPSGLSEIGQIAIVVRDVPKATDFYRDVLGLKFLFGAGPNMAFLAAGSVRLMLTTPQGAGEAGKNSILFFKTSDIEAEYAAIVARGAKGESTPRMVAKMPDHDLWLAAVRDPEGNIIELMSEVRKQAS
jgi:predicted enzyme related to lactoylglutathione lyase